MQPDKASAGSSRTWCPQVLQRTRGRASHEAFPGASPVGHLGPATQEGWEALWGYTQEGESARLEEVDHPSRVSSAHHPQTWQPAGHTRP